MKCSFVIPVYNVEAYLEKCVDSVLKQSSKNFEIILVNDGSTDGSGIICDKLKKKNPKNIKCIHQDNHGLSYARNIGITEAEGDYIIFLDSDDYIENSNFLSAVFPEIDMPDIIAYSWKEVPDGERDSAIQPNHSLMKLNGYYNSGKDFLREAIASNHSYTWYPWKYLFRREFWNKHKFKFSEGLKYEDVDLMYKVILASDSVCVKSSVIGYCYRTQRKDSIVYQVNINTYTDMLNVAKNNIASVQNIESIDNELKTLLCNNFSHIYYAVMLNTGFINDKEKRNYMIKLLKQHRDMCKYTIDKKYLPIKMMVYCCGVRLTSGLLGVRTRLKYGVRD